MTWTVLSPHLDDAVFGCGDWLAAHPGSRVVTVFAGVPESMRLTDWDRRCGFRSAAQAVAMRRDEDRRALDVLQATTHWLPFFDSQYGTRHARDVVADELRRVFAGRDLHELVVPLGLFHSDHVLAHAAATDALAALGIRSVLAYEDALYRRIGGLLQARLAVLRERGIEATPAKDQPARRGHGKDDAVRCYASQLRAFGPHGHDDLDQPERLWRLEFRPRGRSEERGRAG